MTISSLNLSGIYSQFPPIVDGKSSPRSPQRRDIKLYLNVKQMSFVSTDQSIIAR